MPRLFLLLTLLLGGSPPVLNAQADTVRIGAYISDLYDINLSENSFSTQFWVWFNYRDSSLHPLETLELPNAKSVDYSLGFTEPKDGVIWASQKVTAVVRNDWDVRRFPFDVQHMQIELEESIKDVSSLVYVADRANTKLDPRLKISSWEIRGFDLTVANKNYETNFGDPTLSTGSEFSRATLSITIKRKSPGLFFSLFTGLYVAFFISTLAFFIDPIDLDPRFGLSVGALFAAVGNKYIVDSILPQSTEFTLVDKVHILTYIFILLCIVWSVTSLRIWKNGDRARSARWDRRAYFLILSLYVLINVWLIYRASAGGR
jgi:hypothetical protein